MIIEKKVGVVIKFYIIFNEYYFTLQKHYVLFILSQKLVAKWNQKHQLVGVVKQHHKISTLTKEIRYLNGSQAFIF